MKLHEQIVHDKPKDEKRYRVVCFLGFPGVTPSGVLYHYAKTVKEAKDILEKIAQFGLEDTDQDSGRIRLPQSTALEVWNGRSKKWVLYKK